MIVEKTKKDKEKIELLAKIEHEQWMCWASNVIGEVSSERAVRWDKYLVPYANLEEKIKEEDRKWARKVFEILK